MSASWRIGRRTMLRGLGTALALPWLEAMPPLAAAGSEGNLPPINRMAFLYVPNGIHMPDWKPEQEGSDFELPYILEPLGPFQKSLMVFSGLACDKARANGDGAGDHARSLAAFLTGAQARKTHGADLKAGISADQIAAQRVGERTKLPSLELGCEAGLQAGNCDSGYSCAYSANLSWRGESTPTAKEVNPRSVFERLFSDGGAAEQEQSRLARAADRRSILDFVLEDAGDLRRRLGTKDQRKMDEYLSSVREIEARITRSQPAGRAQPPDFAKPDGIPPDFGAHLRLMADLMVLAFQGDLTRISTFVFANEGSNRSYPQVDAPEGHHELSHHGNDPAKQKKIREINRFHITHFAYLLDKLQAIREGERSLLENSMIVYGSAISDGNRHDHDDLPVLLAGHGSGTIRSGRHIRFDQETPLSNLFLSMLDRVDAPLERLGDSTGRLELS